MHGMPVKQLWRRGQFQTIKKVSYRACLAATREKSQPVIPLRHEWTLTPLARRYYGGAVVGIADGQGPSPCLSCPEF